jgi:Uma2 family endonuclease
MGVVLWEGTSDETWLPTQDDLPCSDGRPMETLRHTYQMVLLMMPLLRAWRGREFFVGGNMFLYYSMQQVRNRDFMGPDVFVVLDVPPGFRKSWVMWEEGKGPDVVIELLSESTEHLDRVEKKRLYQEVLRVPDYFWYDPWTGEVAGFALRNGRYEPIEPDAAGRLRSEQLGLLLGRWEGEFAGERATWLRWMDAGGALLSTDQEAEEEERQRAERLASKLRELGVDPDE